MLVMHGLKRAAKLSTYINPFEEKGVEDWPSIYDNYPTYPEGYERLELGPTRVLEILRRRKRHAAMGAETPSSSNASKAAAKPVQSVPVSRRIRAWVRARG